MTKKDWTNIYGFITRWAGRCAKYAIDHGDEAKGNSWLQALLPLLEIHNWLYDRVSEQDEEKFLIRSREWFSVCHKYINQARKKNNYLTALVMFEVWQTGRQYIGRKRPNICEYKNYCRGATEEEFAKAKAEFPIELFQVEKKEDLGILTYRSLNAPINLHEDLALVCDAVTGLTYKFQLIWDWWYPIDEYLDLTAGWPLPDLDEKEPM